MDKTPFISSNKVSDGPPPSVSDSLSKTNGLREDQVVEENLTDSEMRSDAFDDTLIATSSNGQNEMIFFHHIITNHGMQGQSPAQRWQFPYHICKVWKVR
jgi:hypothetical protein